MKLEEEKIDELTKKEEYEMIKAQLKAKRMEEDRKIAEEKRSVETMLELSGESQVLAKTYVCGGVYNQSKHWQQSCRKKSKFLHF